MKLKSNKINKNEKFIHGKTKLHDENPYLKFHKQRKNISQFMVRGKKI